jgi:flagellar hook-length control protein FliK
MQENVLPSVPSLPPADAGSVLPAPISDAAAGASAFGQILDALQRPAVAGPPDPAEALAQRALKPEPDAPVAPLQATEPTIGGKGSAHPPRNASKPVEEVAPAPQVAASMIPEQPPPVPDAPPPAPPFATSPAAPATKPARAVSAGAPGSGRTPDAPVAQADEVDEPVQQFGVAVSGSAPARPRTADKPDDLQSTVAPPLNSAGPRDLRPVHLPVQSPSQEIAAPKADRKVTAETDAPAAPRKSDMTPLVVEPEQAPAQVAAPTSVKPAAVAGPASPPEPAAAQVAPALLTLAKTADGRQQMTVRLNPVELGMVQIRLDRLPSGSTQVQITTDRPETLQALQHDQPALHRTLDDAGVPSTGRTISFHAAHPEPPAGAATGADAARSGNQAPNHPARGNASGLQSGSGGGGTSEPWGRDQSGGRSTGHSFRKGGPAGPDGAIGTISEIYRIGLNITA